MENQNPWQPQDFNGKSPLLKKLLSTISSLPNLWLNLWQPRRCFLNCTSAQSQTIMQINLDFNFIQRRVRIWSFSQCVHPIHHIRINSFQKCLHQCTNLALISAPVMSKATKHKEVIEEVCLHASDELSCRMSAKQIDFSPDKIPREGKIRWDKIWSVKSER